MVVHCCFKLVNLWTRVIGQCHWYCAFTLVHNTETSQGHAGARLLRLPQDQSVNTPSKHCRLVYPIWPGGVRSCNGNLDVTGLIAGSGIPEIFLSVVTLINCSMFHMRAVKVSSLPKNYGCTKRWPWGRVYCCHNTDQGKQHGWHIVLSTPCRKLTEHLGISGHLTCLANRCTILDMCNCARSPSLKNGAVLLSIGASSVNTTKLQFLLMHVHCLYLCPLFPLSIMCDCTSSQDSFGGTWPPVKPCPQQ